MLTERQTAVLECIRSFARQGRSPSIAEIGRAVGIATTPVIYHLKNLERLGYLRRQKWEHRSIILIEQPLKQAA